MDAGESLGTRGKALSVRGPNISWVRSLRVDVGDLRQANWSSGILTNLQQGVEHLLFNAWVRT